MRLPDPGTSDRAAVPRLVAGAVALVVLAVLAWRLADLLLLVFAAIVLAMVLHLIATPIRARTPLGPRAAVTAALILLTAASGLTAWLFGSQLTEQILNLLASLPRAWAAVRADLAGLPGGPALADQIEAGFAGMADGKAWDLASGLIGGVAPAATATVIVIFVAIYLAYHPRTYLDGTLLLVPPGFRARAAEVVESCRLALTRWLLGQLVSVVFVGVTATLGLWAVGAPAPLALGLFAGLGQLVPVVGPTAAALLGALVAFPHGLAPLAKVMVVYVAITQGEANLLTPLVLRQMAQVPMAVTLFAVMAMGMLFGALGVLLATPLAVVAYVLVRRLYLEDTLHERLADTPAGPNLGRQA